MLGFEHYSITAAFGSADERNAADEAFSVTWNFSGRLLKKAQMRGAREWTRGGVLFVVRRREFIAAQRSRWPFSPACLEGGDGADNPLAHLRHEI